MSRKCFCLFKEGCRDFSNFSAAPAQCPADDLQGPQVDWQNFVFVISRIQGDNENYG